MAVMSLFGSLRRRFVLCVVASPLMFAFAGCAVPSRQGDALLIAFTGPTMGATYTVKVAPDRPLTREEKEAVQNAIAAVLENINAKMSVYRPDSEISRFNEHRDPAPFPLSQETMEVFQLARRISVETDGAFDITISPLVDLWGFGPGRNREGRVPEDEEIAAVRDRIGYDKIELDPAAGTARKLHPELSCDVGAIAPGYASDKIAEALERLGHTNYMIEIGGEVRARGRNAEGRTWRIGIEKPDPAGRAVHLVVPLRDAALSTSGDYRNFFEKDGKRYCHEIDPRTGRPITHHLASVSVIGPDCASADAYATALMILGVDEGLRFAETHELAAFFIVREASGRFIEHRSPAFIEYMSCAADAGESTEDFRRN